uniref:DNA (cytosine-5-)-methyltransferase n=1 Tax=Fervidicoccus fontis TaxID=683846 RepID=A0A7J3ZIQ5_9CREN
MKSKGYSNQVVDLFCGGGGFSRGFHEAGFTVTLGVDNLKSAAKTFKLNFPQATTIAEDIKEIDGHTIHSILEDRPEVIIGSPPCEPFTAANPSRMKKPIDRLYVDPMGRLVLHFIRIVSEIRPKVWVMENVPGILESELEYALKREFRRAGYPKVYFNVLRAEDYCTPSRRVRVFISNIPLEPEKCARKITVKEALSGLPPPNTREPPNHEPPTASPRKVKKIKKLKQGQALIYYEGSGGRRIPNVIRLKEDETAPPVLGSSRFVHPTEDRFLTVREQARLMGYPDSHIFLGGRDEQYDMVGESVPPPLSRAIATYIKSVLSEGEVE